MNLNFIAVATWINSMAKRLWTYLLVEYPTIKFIENICIEESDKTFRSDLIEWSW